MDYNHDAIDYQIIENEIISGIYEHYKGGRYEVLGAARFSENPHQKFVVYKSLFESKFEPEGTVFPAGTLWVRPQEMFNENIINPITGKEIKRFKKIS